MMHTKSNMVHSYTRTREREIETWEDDMTHMDSRTDSVSLGKVRIHVIQKGGCAAHA